MMGNPKLGIVVSHPIQYYAPLFKYLAQRLNIIVFYCHDPTDEEIGRDGFGLKFKWDVNLLEGYEYLFLENRSSKPDLTKFNGCNTPDIGKKLKEHGVTHILIMGWYLRSYWQAFFYCLRNSIPVSVRGDSQLNPGENKIKSLLKALLYPLFIKRYDMLFYVGERNKQYLLKHGATTKQLVFAPHAVDQEFWQAPIPDSGTKASKIIFLWIAKFIPKKQPFDAVKAFLKAYEQDNNIELWMIGSGELLEETMKIAGKCEGLKFPGFKNQTQLREIFSLGHCLILTSNSEETWGLVVNEGFAMGMPAIVSDACGCVPDLIQENQTGFVYESGNLTQLTEKITLATSMIRSGNNSFINSIKQKKAIYSYEGNFIALKSFIYNNSK